MSLTASVIVPTVSGERTARLLRSLDGGGDFEVLVVDNGTGDPRLAGAVSELPAAELVRLESNLGYSRAVNLAAARAGGEVLVLLNDDCVVEPGYVERIGAALDPGADVTMAAGVMLDVADPGLIDSAGMELDRTLLVFDYLNGEPIGRLETAVADPIGPSAAAAAIWREAFALAGGFDERLFAYWEDVDLVLRLRRMGARCRLAAGARGTHEHSATLGPGSARKDYLMGFGRGYVLRTWGVLSPARLAPVLARELSICAGQAAVDRNLAGVRGRVRGLRAATRREPYPGALLSDAPPSLGSTLARRWRRRRRLRSSGR
jgi:N-acetylglucosaminyl-diphospho-decaprenol L-rhamnosyltransferase